MLPLQKQIEREVTFNLNELFCLRSLRLNQIFKFRSMKSSKSLIAFAIIKTAVNL